MQNVTVLVDKKTPEPERYKLLRTISMRLNQEGLPPAEERYPGCLDFTFDMPNVETAQSILFICWKHASAKNVVFNRG